MIFEPLHQSTSLGVTRCNTTPDGFPSTCTLHEAPLRYKMHHDPTKVL